MPSPHARYMRGKHAMVKQAGTAWHGAQYSLLVLMLACLLYVSAVAS